MNVDDDPTVPAPVLGLDYAEAELRVLAAIYGGAKPVVRLHVEQGPHETLLWSGATLPVTRARLWRATPAAAVTDGLRACRLDRLAQRSRGYGLPTRDR